MKIKHLNLTRNPRVDPKLSPDDWCFCEPKNNGTFVWAANYLNGVLKDLVNEPLRTRAEVRAAMILEMAMIDNNCNRGCAPGASDSASIAVLDAILDEIFGDAE